MMQMKTLTNSHYIQSGKSLEIRMFPPNEGQQDVWTTLKPKQAK